MNDRFKFRGVLTVEYGSENADDKTVDLIIEKADAIYSGDIGFDIDQLDAAIEKAGIIDDIEIDNIHEFCYDNNGCRSDEYFVMDGNIEQCTGLKDKNGNLIYEGDVVKIPDDYETYGFMSGEKREVYFRDGGFRLKPKNTKLGRGHWLEQTSALEIIGNIHEQPEQKDK